MFFKKFYLNNKVLDKYQSKAVFCNCKRYLVVAGAGSGKTLVIVGKVKYLIDNLGISNNKILCISFTNETVNALINSLEKNNLKVDVKTFHRLALDILSGNKNMSIASSSLLDYVVEEFFSSIIYFDNTYKLLNNYLDINNLSYDAFILGFKKICITFIKLFKSCGYDLSFFLNLLNSNIDVYDKMLLVIIFKVYVLYQDELTSTLSIDFDDMLKFALDKVDFLYYFKYKYIIIDEFQDTSFVKFSLIKKLIDKFNISLMAVGDDYQSIYSFTGCDVKLFLDFKKNITGSRIIKLKNNYRNPKDIVDISLRFVLKNKMQMKKSIRANNFFPSSIVIVYSKDISNDVSNIVLEYDNILILGRNNKDLECLADDVSFSYNNKFVYLRDPFKDIRFLTVHSAKGLESEYVILLNVVDDVLGFPNKIVDNSLYKYLNINKETYLFAEERRLFYVALTRAKKKIFLFTRKGNESLFILELLRDYKYKIKIIDFEQKNFE